MKKHLKVSAVVLALAVLCQLSAPARAVNPQGWLKKAGKQKTRRFSSKQTMVAAVRGVDEPSQVDPAARNFEGVDKMDKRSFDPAKVAQFMSDGKLAVTSARGGK